ncbi:MAG: hypothetical protein H6Q90_528 [Deltaproteobacteria bacterium]|nr:hypothetical protein [Deltaproteobacteria bacterium]
MRSIILALFLAAACGKSSGQPATERTSGSGTASGSGTDVLLCDGKTKVTIPGNTPPTRASGQQVSDALMAQWKQQNPGGAWEEDVRRSHAHAIKPPADNRAVFTGAQRDAQTYGQYTEVDLLTWERETLRAVYEGARVFHSGEELGSTIGVSCDMCHPDAANTHPETYPKFQPQMGRVVLLRDMINWCIEHPLRGTAFAADDRRMRALETYIYAQRSGTPLTYGKH